MKDQLLNWIENAADLAVELETELTKRPAVSPESGGEGELDKCVYLEEWLRSHGVTQLERYDAPDPNAKGGVRPNLIATIQGPRDPETQRPSDPCLWIMSHLDVVPPGELNLWKTDPWTVKQEEDEKGIRLIGRGVEDNQQGIVASVLAAMAFTSQGLTPSRTIKLLFASDEEVGSAYGIEWLVQNHRGLFKKDDMVLVPDGGDPKGEAVEIAEKNILWMKFVTTGKQGHGSKPDLACNAMLAGSELALCLHYELSNEFFERDPVFDPDYSTFQPTKREANVPNINTIPGEDIFYFDMRILPSYKTEWILEQIDNIKSIIEEKNGVAISYEIIQRMESSPTSQDALIVKLLRDAVNDVYKATPKPVGIGGGTVAAHLRNIGIDCAVWTKTDQTLHQPNEYALVANILGDAKVMALLAI